MRSELRHAYDNELGAARDAERAGDPARAFGHLERAHILSQRFTMAHVRVHVAMLGFGWRRSDRREIVGQLTRIVAAALFSRLWIPEGNTGGANVNPLKPMPVPDDLATLLQRQNI